MINKETNSTAMSKTEIAYKQMIQQGIPVWEDFKEEVKRPMEVTTELLMNILSKNKDTEFGKKYDFANIKTIEDYQKKVPVAVFDDFAPYIERMLKGESNLLVAEPVYHFNTTSGTVGSRKYIPLTNTQTSIFLRYNRQAADGLIAEKIGTEWTKGRVFCTSEGNAQEYPNGITVGSASARMAKVVQNGTVSPGNGMEAMFTSPMEAMFPGTENDTKYLHCRFALMDKNISGIITGFYSNVVLLFRYIEDNWQMLVDDIENGTIDSVVRITDEYRESLAKKIKPMPERARELREIFSKGFDEPFIPKVWPKMQFIQGAGGDGLAVFDKIIKERYSGGCLTNFYAGVTASEGLWSVPYDIERTDSVIAPGSAFLEFLPIEAGDDFSQCVTLDRLETGRVYEIIATDHCGLYRYRTSDAVKVVDKFGNTPTVDFMFRVNKTVNLIAEKTTEAAISSAVMKTIEKHKFQMVDYTLLPDAYGSKPQYVFFIEPIIMPNAKLVETLRKTLETELGLANLSFKGAIEKGNMLPPDLRILQPETYLLYRDIMVMKGTTPSQLKPVHVTGNPFQEKFFLKLVETELPE